ncbi:3-deoxy-manno-octulosonate cytidylyltransferase [Chitinispirillales bacterium ANBcel5]|uniref:3-deoxy-manno-octulosonate cytidylyltransferase n=1 Tax=Cellulosispirillum alkaliphilum TaxID=3039283 RepID=UPI002A54DFB0|nr:3-deoxy-manno-octulosonate cytidylyltransferase [Chitinispirillales bacterium ANBcel5]
MNKKIICVIPARYGSSRLSGKPLQEIMGLPLVMWAYKNAQKAGVFTEIVVATDDYRIVEAVDKHGGVAVMTSKDHTRGTDRVNEAIGGSDCSYVVNLQGDEPNIPLEVMRMFCAELQKIDDNSLLTVLSNAKITEVETPHVVKAVLNLKGEALYFSRSLIPYGMGSGEESFYKHHGIYGFTKFGLKHFCSLPEGVLEKRESLEQLRALEHGMKIKCVIHDFKSFGIDTPEDLKRFREYQKNKNG